MTESTGGENLGEVLGAIARTLQAEPNVESTLAAIIKAAVDHIAGAQDAGISLVERRKRIHTVVLTSPIVGTIDDAQYRSGQGPCIDAIAEHHTFRTGNLLAEPRWPEFTPIAARTGIRSMLSYRLFVTETTLGALNLYSRQPEAFTVRTEQEGRLFATHAAIALAGAQTEARLTSAVESRDAIGMAKGILMQRHDIDPAQAFRILVESSQHTNLKLSQVAAWLIEHRREL